MSLPQHIVLDEGGTITVNRLSYPDNATVSVIGPNGAAYVEDQTATVSAIDDTLNAAVTAGDTVVTLSNAAEVAEDKVFWIRTPDEAVKAKTISGNDVTVWAPTLYAHENGSTVEGSEISYTVSSSDADTLFFDGRAKWTFNEANSEFTAVECTKYPLSRKAMTTDLYREYPKIADELDTEVDAESLLDLAHGDLLTDIGAKGRARVFTGSVEFIRATILKSLTIHFRRIHGTIAEEMRERYQDAYNAELEKVVFTTPRDADQDGTIEANEVLSMRSVRLSRA